MLEEKESIVTLATALATARHLESSITRIHEALDEIEQLIFQHKDSFGVANEQFQQGCEEFLLLCNTAAIQHLQCTSSDEDRRLCGDLLTRAEQHTRRAGYLRSVEGHVSNRLQLRVLSLNNLACFNKHIEKPLAAIGCLEKVLEIQLRQHDASDTSASPATTTAEAVENAIALTHLNLCAVLSQMKRHDAAAQHARAAIDMLARLEQSEAKDTVDWNLQLVAHYNLAVEMEHLHDVAESNATCAKGLAIARQRGLDGEHHEVVSMLEELSRSQRVGKALVSPRSLSPRRVPRQGRAASPRFLRQK